MVALQELRDGLNALGLTRGYVCRGARRFCERLFFHGTWSALIAWVLGPVLSIGFWCFLFMGLIPLIERLREARTDLDDDYRSNAA